jgi:ATP-dependent protease Clp ATPase subunit
MSDSPTTPALHEQRCSFCREPRAKVRSLILGPGVSICDACTQRGLQIVREDTAGPVPHDVACSFCRKAHPEIHALIPGPEVHICDACVQLGGEILDESAVVSELPLARVRKKQRWWKRLLA